MLDRNWREKTWASLDQLWDVIVIGGGITGAGIFNMAAQKGLKVALVEARDFAFGTSSRSSKLVHGGIRYLKNRQFDVVRESVKERERLIRESDGLVDPLQFIFPAYDTNPTETNMMRMGVIAYDLMAPKWQHDFLHRDQVKAILPALDRRGLEGGVQYYDSRLDDSQLVLRVIMDGIRFGGQALNYAMVMQLCKAKSGRVEGVLVQDETRTLSPSQVELRGNVVINATGPWSDELREQVDGEPRLRRLRGSHLIFSKEKLPINAAVTMLHPRDGRALFAIPWENRTMIGTTDLDHELHEDETRITPLEYEYLMEATAHAFPDYPVTDSDLIASFSGLRPVINTNAPTPSKESRAHQIWEEDGLVTVAGGKLTIFRVMAADVLNFCREQLPGLPKFDHFAPCFIHPEPAGENPVSDSDWTWMAGRLGKDVNLFFDTAGPESLDKINPTPHLWGELAWAAQNEAVFHLDDLLLRRVRLGLLLPNGGLNEIDRIRELVQSLLGWDGATWAEEVTRYKEIHKGNYHLPQ
ncbi:MAG: glycerol-3-phosphate dehydrogenase/oxidase [Chloroflexota bacterium]|nr:glycerol-3-phosphate dehydrogenase/oxidase [Chloroflexota bacterium]